MTTPAPARSTIEGLQLLRGCAASLVVGFHLFEASLARPDANAGLFRLFRHGETGVDLFFVLSGFIIFYTASRARSFTTPHFLAARFWRIYPPYWLVLAATLLVTVLANRFLGTSEALPDGATLGISTLLLPLPGHVIIIAWTLGLEITFYAIFALTFRHGRTALIAAMAVWAVIGQVVRVGILPAPDLLVFLTHSVVLEFLFGVLIACFATNLGPKVAKLALAAGTLWILGLTTGAVPELPIGGREMSAGIPSALVVMGLANLRMSLPRWTLVWGDASYLLYLSHLLVLSVSGQVLQRIAGFDPYTHWAGMVVLFVLATIVAVVGHLWIERPYQRVYKRFLRT